MEEKNKTKHKTAYSKVRQNNFICFFRFNLLLWTTVECFRFPYAILALFQDGNQEYDRDHKTLQNWEGVINDVKLGLLWFGPASSDPSKLLLSVTNNFGG